MCFQINFLEQLICGTLSSNCVKLIEKISFLKKFRKSQTAFKILTINNSLVLTQFLLPDFYKQKQSSEGVL